MASGIAQMSLGSSRTAVGVCKKALPLIKPAPHAARPVPRHVMRANKLAELEETEVKLAKKSKHDDEHEECGENDGLSPQQVETFLSVLCEETDIAEVELKMGGFKMKVRRSLKGSAAAPPAPSAAAAAAPAPASAPAAPPAYAAAPSVPDLSIASYDEDDESVLQVSATKVGILRRGRYVKGKQVGKGAAVEVGDKVKKGQVICYVEQLGTHWPVECPQAGEVASFLVEEGAAVEYLEAVAEIAPFFGGHIIGDSKYA